MRGPVVRLLLLTLCLGAQALPAGAQSAAVASPPAAHLEVMLSGEGVAPREGAPGSSVALLREPAFLDRPAAAVADPLAPCALLTAVVSADLMNRMFFGLIRPGGFDFRPPPGTQILGRYDAVLARAKGAIPRDDPVQAADLLARSVVARSGGISGMLDKPSSPSANPLLPCALLGAFRQAARINDAWANALPAGKLDSAGRVELAPYAQALRQPLAAGGASVATAELLAAVLDAEIRRANWLSRQLAADATQRECLDEMFAPGGLRIKAMRAGKTLPLR